MYLDCSSPLAGIGACWGRWGFGAIDVPDQEIWSIVAFVKKLPTVSDEDFKTWTRQVRMPHVKVTADYRVAKLVAQYGKHGNMSKWVSELRGDCPKRNTSQLHERCDLICPDLANVL